MMAGQPGEEAAAENRSRRQVPAPRKHWSACTAWTFCPAAA